MFKADVDIGLWISEIPVPIIYSQVEEDEVCESFGVRITKIKALANPRGTISFLCGIICNFFRDRGTEYYIPRSECEKNHQPCIYAPERWDGKLLRLN